MSAELLREAASILRERSSDMAEFAPWGSDGEQVTGGNRQWMLVANALSEPRDETAAYIAMMHPGVGLALADWLDAAGADLWAHGPLCCNRGCEACDDDLWAPHVRKALELARMIVGEQ